MRNFLEKFNRLTDGQFSLLKLSKVKIATGQSAARFFFVAPESLYDFALQNIDKIKKGVEQAHKTTLSIEISIKKDHFDFDFFCFDLINFFDSYPSLNGVLTKDKISVNAGDDDKKDIQVTLWPSAFSLFNSKNLKADLDEFVDSNYCEPIIISVIQSQEKEEFLTHSSTEIVYDDPSGRYIDVSEVTQYIGKQIIYKPKYICDAVLPKNAEDAKEKIILSGKIIELRELARKIQDATKPKPNFYKIALQDPTGKINCVFFPNQDSLNKAKSLTVGTDVLVEGELKNDTFSGGVSLNIRNISLCVLPKNFVLNRKKIKTPTAYRKVFPVDYVQIVQDDFTKIENFSNAFDSLDGGNLDFYQKDQTLNTQVQNQNQNNSEIAPYLIGKTFVVFDLETTGLNKMSDHIIEIGAVKIVDGQIKQTFCSLFDPKVPLSEKTTFLTGLTDADVKNAPLIGEILPDFLLFCEGAS
ncbi:MAG: exonuclease domain-containing protein, partial [Firmicutes bacterium]|nr:exonuclease domain-containing protein [Bacillota bacterium]